MARPTDYSLEIASKLCERIADGRGVKPICEQDEDMPSRTTVYRWLAANPEFRDMYALAHEDRADVLADEIIEIADDGSRDYSKDEDGQFAVNHDHIQRSKLRVDARKFIAAKLKPRKYGERQTVAHEGFISDRPIEERSEAELLRMLAEIEAQKTKPE